MRKIQIQKCPLPLNLGFGLFPGPGPRYSDSVADDSFADAALILVGHGSTVNAASSAPIYQHAEALQRRGIFAEVRTCFWKIDPAVGAVLQGLDASRIFIVPLFMSEGYFTEQIIPRELGFSDGQETNFARTQRRGAQVLYYGAPVGTHPRMTDVVLARARDVVERHPFPRAPKPADTALFLAGHGTEKNENSRKALDLQVDWIRKRRIYAECHAVFLEEDPRIGDCYTLARARNVILVPFFISDGLHAFEDIPVLLGEPERVVRDRLQEGQFPWRNPTERHGKRLWYTRSVGTEPLIAEVILERVREQAREDAGGVA
jgi:sirohydrochlorin cobaltochelatase